MVGRRSAVVVALIVVAAGLAVTANPTAAVPPNCVTTGGADSPALASGGFTAIAPVRVLDTRVSTDPGAAGDRLAADCTTALVLPEAVAPAGTTAVALTVTAVGATAAGYVTVFPCSVGRPLASNVNPRPGAVVSNLVVVAVGDGRRVCAYSSVATHLVVDATGWFGAGGQPYHASDGARLVDTRTIADRKAGPDGRVASGDDLRLAIGGQHGVPAAATAAAVNLTVVDALADGYAVAYPCGDAPPTSTVPARAGASARAGQSYVGLAPGGELCVRTSVAAHVVVDLVGWFGPDGAGAPGQELTVHAPQRVADTRTAGVAAVRTFRFDLAGSGALAPNATTAVLDVVATGTALAGWVVLYPCGQPAPPTSSVNQQPGDDVANVVTVAVGDDGAVCGVASTATDLVVDVLGSFAAPGPLVSLRVGGGAVALSPRFDAAGLDYSVRCPASGTLDVPIVATGAPGTTVSVAGPAGIAPPGRTATTVEHLHADDLVTVAVTRGASTLATYAVRCLPNDFPLVRTVTHTNPTPGWYLMANTYGPSSSRFAFVLDERGAVVWYRRTSTPVLDVKRLPGGTVAWVPLLAANTEFGADPTTVYLEQALDGTQIRSYAAATGPTDDHDLVALPNGNVLVLTYEREPGVVVPGTPACANATHDVWWSTIEEIDVNGTLVWTWRSRDHLAPADSTYLPREPIDGCDLQHADALDVAANGDVIVTMRHLDAVLRIRRDPGNADDGTIVWRLGGNATSYVFLDDVYGGPARPHDARLSADGTLLSLVDNRTDRTGQTARAVEYRIDPIAHTARLVWSRPFVAPLTGQPWSAGFGSVRRQADGHVVVGWGDQTSPQLTEYDAAGRVALAVDTPDSWGYRVVKEPAPSFDRVTLRATAGGGP